MRSVQKCIDGRMEEVHCYVYLVAKALGGGCFSKLSDLGGKYMGLLILECPADNPTLCFSAM